MQLWTKSAREAVVLGLLLAVALVLHSLERMVPVPQVAPGIKLGLANTASLIGLFILPYGQVVVLVILRSIATSMMGGGLSAFLFSAVGGLASATAMRLALIHGSRAFSVVSVSVIGALVHNTGQLLIAASITGTPRLYIYMPILMVSGGITGLVVGVISMELLRRLVQADVLKPMQLEDAYKRYLWGAD